MFTYPVQPICTFSCTSVFFINIYYPQYTVLHILSHCTSYTFYFIICSLFHSHLYLYIYIYIYSLVLCFIVLLLMLFLFFLHFPLSGPVPTYISLLIIPCMIVYVTNNKEPIPAPAGSPRLLPGRRTVGCPLLHVCALGWVKCREHISLLIILCIIVYVTNKAHLSFVVRT